jgi:hypothetical protein
LRHSENLGCLRELNEVGRIGPFTEVMNSDQYTPSDLVFLELESGAASAISSGRHRVGL